MFRATLFAGDTYDSLEDHMLTNNTRIDLHRDTVYCMDNESFKYIVAHKKGIDMGQAHLYKESWEQAR